MLRARSARKIAAPLSTPYQHNGLAGVVLVDLAADFGSARCDLFFAEKDGEVFVDVGVTHVV